jgi:hypothetical protein
LERMAEAADSQPEATVFACHVVGIDRDGNLLAHDERADWFNRNVDYNAPESWLWQNPVCHNGAVIRRAAHQAVGGMSLQHHPAPDWDLWIRFLSQGFKFEGLPEVLVESRVHGGAVTGTAQDRLVREYAMTSADTLHPWLLSLDRADLVVENLVGFLNRPEFRQGCPEYPADIVERLWTGPEMTPGLFASALQAFARDHHRLVTENHDLTHARDATEAQLARTQQSLADTQRRLAAASERLGRIETLPGFQFALKVRRSMQKRA